MVNPNFKIVFYKFIISFLTLLLTHSLAFSSPAAILVIQYKNVNGPVGFRLPVNNSIFHGSYKQVNITSDTTLHFLINESETGLVSINPGGALDHFVRLYVQKGDSIIVDIDPLNAVKIKISGNNALGQQLLNRFLFKGPSRVKDYRLDTTAVQLEQHVIKDKDSCISLFKRLRSQNLIDESFLRFIVNKFEYYYASVIAQIIADRNYKYLVPKTDISYQAGTVPQSFQILWSKIYNKYPPNDIRAIQTLDDVYSEYFRTYTHSYITLLEIQSGILPMSHSSDEEFYNKTFGRIFKYFDNPKIAEYVAADRLQLELYQQKFQYVLLKLYNSFKKKFPVSKYLKYLEPLAEKFNNFYTSINRDFSPVEHFIENFSQINSFEELISTFKGKPIFVDMWATWCGPCKEQFAFNHGLDSFLLKNGVDMLYISMDTPERDTMWKNMIKYFGLKGNHIRTNDFLRNDLIKTFWDGNNYAIPRYIFLDKNGTISEIEPLRPGDGIRLYNKLKQLLN